MSEILGYAPVKKLKRTRKKDDRKWLTEPETNRLIESFNRDGPPEYYWIYVLCRYGLRIGEILGRYSMPGIYIKDLRENGIILNGKGYSKPGDPAELYPLPAAVMSALSKWVSRYNRKGKLFSLSVSSAEKMLKRRARDLHIDGWERVGPHRLRAFFATDAKDHGIDAFSIRDMMRHRNVTTTNQYVGRSTSSRIGELMEKVSSVPQASGGPGR